MLARRVISVSSASSILANLIDSSVLSELTTTSNNSALLLNVALISAAAAAAAALAETGSSNSPEEPDTAPAAQVVGRPACPAPVVAAGMAAAAAGMAEAAFPAPACQRTRGKRPSLAGADSSTPEGVATKGRCACGGQA